MARMQLSEFMRPSLSRKTEWGCSPAKDISYQISCKVDASKKIPFTLIHFA